jgi:hypothetical protein
MGTEMLRVPSGDQLGRYLEDRRRTQRRAPSIPGAPHSLDTKLLAPAAKRLHQWCEGGTSDSHLIAEPQARGFAVVIHVQGQVRAVA